MFSTLIIFLYLITFWLNYNMLRVAHLTLAIGVVACSTNDFLRYFDYLSGTTQTDSSRQALRLHTGAFYDTTVAHDQTEASDAKDAREPILKKQIILRNNTA